jgi:hypothetical protein
MDEVPLPPRTLNPCTVDRKALAGLRRAVQAHNTCTEDLLAALEAADARTPVPPELQEQAQVEAAHLRRALEWLGGQWGRERHSGQKSDGHGPNCPLQPTVDLRDCTSCPYAPEAWDQPCQVVAGNITWRECCRRSALAATEAGGNDA